MPTQRTAEQFLRLETLFHELQALPPVQQKTRLEQLELDSPELVAELRAMLASNTDTAVFSQAVDQVQDLLGDALDGLTSLGPYRIMRELGRGGMGRVFEAEQEQPVSRRVALKVARPTLVAEAVQARFIAERQALALLDHPNIAKLFDAGSTEDGLLWFAMELVAGEPINDWADREQLSLRARIELMLPVCDAIQHAHQKGLIHRDIKPANLLVSEQDEQARPRVIDFGIAKNLAAELAPQNEQTRVGDVLGTPEYMSPEQASLGEVDVDIRSDVYALGLVLHVLLLGYHPLAVQAQQQISFGAMCRHIREQTIQVPRQRHSGETHAQRVIERDLQRVLQKALANDREHRYGSVAALADDLRRYLANEPVQAAPPQFSYRAGKFVRRHRLVVGLATAAASGLLLLTAVVVFEGRQAALERDRARLQAARAESVMGFLSDMLRSANPANAQGQDVSVRQVLDEANATLSSADLDPVARATLEETLGTTYLSLGDAAQGQPLVQAASQRVLEALGPLDPFYLYMRHAEARFANYQGRYEEAVAMLEPLLQARKQVLGVHMDTASTMHNLAYAYAELGQVEKALALDLQQLDMVTSLSGADSEDALITLSSVGHGYTQLGRLDEAHAVFSRVLKGHRKNLGEMHPMTLSVQHNLAFLASRRNDMDAAEQDYLAVINARIRVLGEQHAQTLNSMSNLGELYLTMQRLDEAEQWLQRALTGRMAMLGEAHPDTLSSRLGVAKLLHAKGNMAAALAAVREVYGFAEQALGADSNPCRKAKELLQQWQRG
jgi:eukaryotic-like serine/threonine-protein kinase